MNLDSYRRLCDEDFPTPPAHADSLRVLEALCSALSVFRAF